VDLPAPLAPTEHEAHGPQPEGAVIAERHLAQGDPIAEAGDGPPREPRFDGEGEQRPHALRRRRQLVEGDESVSHRDRRSAQQDDDGQEHEQAFPGQLSRDDLPVADRGQEGEHPEVEERPERFGNVLTHQLAAGLVTRGLSGGFLEPLGDECLRTEGLDHTDGQEGLLGRGQEPAQRLIRRLQVPMSQLSQDV